MVAWTSGWSSGGSDSSWTGFQPRDHKEIRFLVCNEYNGVEARNDNFPNKETGSFMQIFGGKPSIKEG